jgi:hypothetical protein
MTHRQTPVIYVDSHMLDILTAATFKNDAMRGERLALEKIWQYFKEDRVRLITSSEEMEQDIIIGLNCLGCCVTDIIQITDNIEEFEKWDKVDRNETTRWRQVIDLCDQLEVISEYEHASEGAGKGSSVSRPDKDLFTFFNNDVLQYKAPDDYDAPCRDEDIAILRDCSNDLRNWYGKESWRDLRRIEYDLNWKILEKALRAHSLEPVLLGDKATRNRYLLGLLNRVIGFGKKSCARLPLEHEHVLFIIDAVVKKYYHRGDRLDVHIMKCIGHSIDYFLSVEDELIGRFNERRHLLLLHPDCQNFKLELIRPVELESRLR